MLSAAIRKSAAGYMHGQCRAAAVPGSPGELRYHKGYGNGSAAIKSQLVALLYFSNKKCTVCRSMCSERFGLRSVEAAKKWGHQKRIYDS